MLSRCVSPSASNVPPRSIASASISELSVSIVPQNPGTPGTVGGGCGSGPYRTATDRRSAQRPCDNRPKMALDDRFDDLIASLGGFHRSWLVYLGLELGLFR